MDEPADNAFLYVTGTPYGGLASGVFFRAVLDLRAACATRGIALQLDLAGGEALAARGQAMQVGRFLASRATHLLLTDGEVGFPPEIVIAALDGEPTQLPPPHRLMPRAAVMAALEGAPEGRFADVRGAAAATAAQLCERRIDPVTRCYRPDRLLSGGVP